MQVTISLLPSPLSLVRIPRSRLPDLTHPILKQVLRPDPTFLNITCNEVELSLFADESVLPDFQHIARKDRNKQRARSNSGSSGGSRRGSRSRDIDPVEVSYERWNVLQLDSHNDQIDTSGARVNEVSAPLAAAGISILYQSSYMCDFILVKESRLEETMSLLAEAGFDIYSSGSSSSPINTARPNRSSVGDFRTEPVLSASMTRARSGTDPTAVKLDSNSVWDDHQKIGESLDRPGTPPPSEGTKSPRKMSPSAGDVRLLPSDLACVGLSEELGADHWGLKIVKLVAFPELITSVLPPSYASKATASPVIPNAPSFPLAKSSPLLFDISPPLFHHLARSPSPSESDSSASSSEDDGYMSHSPKSKSTLPSTFTTSSRSHTDLREHLPSASPYKHRSRHIIQPFSPIRPTGYSEVPPDPMVPCAKVSRIPFFSYTRTAEGSSLTADVFVLAALFPPHERHMIICSGELDAADKRLSDPHHFDNLLSLDDDPDEACSEESILTCLQIDLRSFGLDKHGLVNRFSKVLEQNKINHMYSSTFKTANLLVDKQHARRAQALLCTC
ncbi:hypothetical protein H0H92_013224 [Tricholoma furcatifolium]|nr:hypothetical protein H0H92_013224 [Tricholoma furcatifolium]